MTREELGQIAKEVALNFQPHVEALIIRAVKAAGMRTRARKVVRTCSSPDCDNQAVTRGMCPSCYQKWLRNKKKAAEQSTTDVIVEQLEGSPSVQ